MTAALIQRPTAARVETIDTLGRGMRDLRLSVIDACNFRCHYCMPAEHTYHFLKPAELLSVEEMERLTRLFVALGVSKIRLTGGEPLLRRELPQLIARLSTIDGIEDLALSTNGHHLAALAHPLKEAGLRRITVSLDGPDQAAFARMSGVGADLDRVLEGIRAALNAGLRPIKVNMVVQRGVNDHAVLDMVEFAREEGFILRFIEYMDVGTLNGWKAEDVVPSAEILERLRARYTVRPAAANYAGEVASRYVFSDARGEGELGFISSVTQPFCRECTRARLSACGTLYTCLFASSGLDLRGMLRGGATDGELRAAIQGAWTARADRYSEIRQAQRNGTGRHDRVEMYAVGG